MKFSCSSCLGSNKHCELCALLSLDHYAKARGTKVCLPDFTGPIARQAPQIFYGSVFPNRKGRLSYQCESKKEPIRAYQGASDFFLGPGEELRVSENLDLDFEPELAVITDAVPAGVSVAEAEYHIKLLTGCNDFIYRKLVSSDRESGFGFIQSKPLTSFCGFGVLPSSNKTM